MQPPEGGITIESGEAVSQPATDRESSRRMNYVDVRWYRRLTGRDLLRVMSGKQFHGIVRYRPAFYDHGFQIPSANTCVIQRIRSQPTQLNIRRSDWPDDLDCRLYKQITRTPVCIPTSGLFGACGVEVTQLVLQVFLGAV